MCGRTTAEQAATIPKELKPLIEGSTAWTLGLQQNLPLSQFTRYNPQGVADLSPMQRYGLQNVPGLFGTDPMAKGAAQAIGQLPELTSRPVETPSGELAAIMQLLQTTGGPIGSSPSTKAGMEAWKSAVLPTVENEMVQAGLGRSGDLLKSVGASASQAAFPLLQQEVQNRMASVPMLRDIAGAQTERTLEPRRQTAEALKFAATQGTALSRELFQQKVTAIQEAFRAGQITRDVAQSRFDAAKEEAARLQALSEAGTLGPLGQVLPSLLGRKTTQQKDVFSAIMGKAILITAGAATVAALALSRLGVG